MPKIYYQEIVKCGQCPSAFESDNGLWECKMLGDFVDYDKIKDNCPLPEEIKPVEKPQ
jgi:hypothetical protein